MTIDDVASAIEAKFPGKLTEKKAEALNPTLIVSADSLLPIMKFLHDDPALSFDYLRDMTANDVMIADVKKAEKLGIKPRLEVIYQLFSFKSKLDLTVKTILPRWKNDVPGELPELPSVSSVYAIADWHEREVYDLIGINFLGHPNLCRILCAEDWIGHPLRKDYEFPLEYHGIRCR